MAEEDWNKLNESLAQYAKTATGREHYDVFLERDS